MADSEYRPLTPEDLRRMESQPELGHVPHLVAEVRRSWAEGTQCIRDLHYACIAGAEQRERAEAADAELAQLGEKLKGMQPQPDASAGQGGEE